MNAGMSKAQKSWYLINEPPHGKIEADGRRDNMAFLDPT
jgi:hypothetical protein